MTDDLIARLREHAENMYVDFLNDAADALEAQARRIAELEAGLRLSAMGQVKQSARIAELEAALKPFAEIDVSNCADGLVCYFWGFGDNAGKVSAAEIRAACAALEKKNESL